MLQCMCECVSVFLDVCVSVDKCVGVYVCDSLVHIDTQHKVSLRSKLVRLPLQRAKAA